METLYLAGTIAFGCGGPQNRVESGFFAVSVEASPVIRATMHISLGARSEEGSADSTHTQFEDAGLFGSGLH